MIKQFASWCTMPTSRQQTRTYKISASLPRYLSRRAADLAVASRKLTAAGQPALSCSGWLLKVLCSIMQAAA